MSSSLNVNKTALLLSLKNECLKRHYTLDGSLRATAVYEAPVDTLNNGACLVTYYTYSGATTTVTGMVEFIGTWNSAWDITYP